MRGDSGLLPPLVMVAKAAIHGSRPLLGAHGVALCPLRDFDCLILAAKVMIFSCKPRPPKFVVGGRLRGHDEKGESLKIGSRG